MPLRSSLVLIALLLTLSAHAAPLRDRIGVAHVDGKYSVANDGRDYLSEGAQQIREELASRVIKLWLTRKAPVMYAFNSPGWADAHFEHDFTGIADHVYFRNIFEMPFSTFILVVDGREDVWFGDGMTPYEEQAEERAMHDLARYLLEEYAGSGKTFILQNWEADWLLRLGWNNGVVLYDREPTPAAVAGMIQWLNARQRGVERARVETAHLEGVTVKHAIEVNHLRRAKYEPLRITVTRDVLPFVSADLYSYSAWETASDPTGAMLQEMLTYLDEKTPGGGNIYVGEYGAPENVYGTGEHLSRVAAQTRAALDWGALYVIYWQLYCNAFVADPPPGAVLNNDMMGFWLVRPDGTRSPVWDFLMELLAHPRDPSPRVRGEGAAGG